MDRPYIICHMVTSLDGKVTGNFLFDPECAKACQIYYEINRRRKADGFICGRVTMEGSFTGGEKPDLSQCDEEIEKADFIPDDLTGFYAVSFDPKGKLGWKSARIEDPDGDPGYDGAQIVQVLTHRAHGRYLTYLKKLGIAYVFAGEDEIDVPLALSKLKNLFHCETLLLEGGSIVNGYFQRADVIDEISLVVAPIVGEKDDKPLFDSAVKSQFSLSKAEEKSGNLILNYKRV